MCSTYEKSLVTESFRFELDPNRKQRVLMAKSVGASRYVYNWGLAESQRVYARTGTRPHVYELTKRLVGLKKSECPWLYDVSAHIGQQALVDLNRAFEHFFNGLKGEGPRSRFPRFKRKGERDSCRVYEVQLDERHIRIPKLGRVRMKETRSERGFDGRIVSATISRRADPWFVSLAVERDRAVVPAKPVVKPSDVVGIDLGLRTAAVLHDGEALQIVEPHRALRKNLKRLRRLDRRLARKQRGSRNREKARLRRARLYYRVSCQRSDFLHQLSSELTKTKSVIVLEDLQVKGMQQHHSLALSVSDAALAELRRQLTYKSRWYGSTVVLADRFYPSTRLCSRCGTLNEKVKGCAGLKERRFECVDCGLSLDRDENAAINLRAWGLRVLAAKLGIDPLPEGLREVTPGGEEGAGSRRIGAKPASAKQEADSPPCWRDTQKCVERRTCTDLKH